jgi:IS605 OrfB family transposase
MQKCLSLPLWNVSKHKQALLKETYQDFLSLIREHRAVASRATTNTELHHLTYKTMRERGIAAQLIEQARTIAWKGRKNGEPQKCTVRFDKRLFSLSETKRGNPVLSLRLMRKRIGLPMVMYERIKQHLEQGWQLTSVLMTKNLNFYLTMNKDDPPVQHAENILGIDVNASKIAVSIVSKEDRILKQLYLGKQIGSTQYEFEERRAKLQQYRDTITPSKAGLKLKQLSGRQRRYVRTNIWQLANDIVRRLAKQYNAKKIAIEALKHLRSRKKGQTSKQSRRKVNRIPYGLLKHCLTSVCQREGVELVPVNPKHTSQECQKCQYTSKKNWIGYKLFRCERCGFESNRDRNASVNIAARASQFSHPRQMQVLAQISGGDAASVNRHRLKGEDRVESLESVTYPSFRPPDLSGGS